MAAPEDESEFASHFLDSMLEVEMTEEDGEVDISKNEDPLDLDPRILPPIPMFDLQSETLTYKDIYKGGVLAPLAAVSAADAVPVAVPVPNPGSRMPVYSRDVLPATALPSAKADPSTAVVPKIVPKAVKPLVKEPLSKVAFTGTTFVQKVFKPEYVENVFTKKESDGDTSVYGKEEMEFYKSCFTDLTKIQYCRLHCTICDRHIGCGANVEKRLTVHAMLKVMTCKPCHEFYGDGNFPCDQGDNCEIYCRWCGQGGALVCCSYCPRVFCKKCVKLNFGVNFLKSIQRVSDWACFCCAQKPLWPHRAVCRALVEYTNMRKIDGKPPHRDTTKCCGISLWRKQWKPQDKNKDPNLQTQIKVNQVPGNALTTTFVKNKVQLPVKPINRKEQSVLKTSVEVKVNNQSKSPMGPLKILKESPRTNVIPRSIISGNNILRGITTSAPAKIFSPIPSPQLIQTPVLHGETLITPPNSRMILPPKIPATGSSFVRVSLTNQTANLDLNKIPTAKIPHDVQSLILRMSFPDNKVQLVRLISDGNGCKASKQFPMPEFKDLDKASFVEESLSDSFRLSKMLFDRLMFVREKVNTRTDFTEESVFESSVEKLHFIYEKSAELMKELDTSLLEKYEQWKNRRKNSVDLIDLSEEETVEKKSNRREKFLQKCRELVLDEDSDVEILEDVNAPLPNFPESDPDPGAFRNIAVNGNYATRPRAKGTSVDKLKTLENAKAVKRKRGKKGRKRLKLVDNSKKEENKKNYVDHAALQSLMTKLQEARAKRESGVDTTTMRKRRRKQSLNTTADSPLENGVPLVQK